MFTELIIDRVKQLAADKEINEMVDGEILFEWELGEPILIRPDYEEVTPLLYHNVNEFHKENVGNVIILFGDKERYTTEEYESVDDPGGELNKHDNEYETDYVKDSSYENIEASEREKSTKTPD